MLMDPSGIPRVGELVIASVSKISKFGAYCRLIEYNDLEVFLPIREVSSGWIKNIREHIHEGQKLVCTVIFYDKEKNTIDISLKRVSPSNSKNKIRAYNLEKRLGALFLQAVKMSKYQQDKDALVSTALSEFGTYTNLIDNATSDTKEFSQSKLPKKLKDSILKVLEANRKQKRYIVSYMAKVYTQDTLSGAESLRTAMRAVKDLGVEAKYIGAPKYRFVAEGNDYSAAEEKIKKAEAAVKSKIKKGSITLEKEKLRKEKEDIISTIGA